MLNHYNHLKEHRAERTGDGIKKPAAFFKLQAFFGENG
jgi:hypothetical protein